MEKEKQIEEMAKIIRETTFIRGFEYSAAAGIFAAGYGKVKEAVKETVLEIYEEIEKIPYHNFSEEMDKGYAVAISAVLTVLNKKALEVWGDRTRKD